MQMEVRSSLYFTLGSLRTPVASRRCLHRNKAFIIETTKKPGWQLNFSKSSSSLIFCSNRNLSNKSLQVDQRAWYPHAKYWSPHHHAYWQFFWPFHQIWTMKYLPQVFWTKSHIFHSTLWCRNHLLCQGSLSPCLLPSSYWAWWGQWMQHI